MKIYFAAPLFTLAEREWNKSVASQLTFQFGYDVFLPQDHEPREFTARAIFEMDRDGIDSSDAVVAIMDGPDPDSGTCWEVGYAYAKSMPIVAVRTDFRGSGEGNMCPYNLMLSESASKLVSVNSITEMETYNLVKKIHVALNETGRQ